MLHASSCNNILDSEIQIRKWEDVPFACTVSKVACHEFPLRKHLYPQYAKLGKETFHVSFFRHS